MGPVEEAVQQIRALIWDNLDGRLRECFLLGELLDRLTRPAAMQRDVFRPARGHDAGAGAEDISGSMSSGPGYRVPEAPGLGWLRDLLFEAGLPPGLIDEAEPVTASVTDPVAVVAYVDRLDRWVRRAILAKSETVRADGEGGRPPVRGQPAPGGEWRRVGSGPPRRRGAPRG